MSAADAQMLIGSVIGILAVLGAGVKWMLTHIDSVQVKSDLAEERARTDLSNRLYDEIKSLRSQLDKLVEDKSLYLRRIYQLESFIHKHPGIDIPHMEGWPP